MAQYMTIVMFFLAIFTTIISCNAAGISGDPFLDGYNATCAYSYQTGCQIGQQKYGEGAYHLVAGVLGAYLSYIAGMTPAFACGLCESGFFGDGNTTHGGTEAECCPNTGPQCGNSAFQQAYNDVHPASCRLGYDVGKGKFGKSSLITLGAYYGIVNCFSQGILACSSFGQAVGVDNADQILANVANVLKK